MLTFNPPLMNAAGVRCTTADELDQLGASRAGAIVTKSMTLNDRHGNPEPRYTDNAFYSINSMGLPNRGVEYYCAHAQTLRQHQKPVIASIAGFSPDEYIALMERVVQFPFDAVEVNLSCPNVERHGILAYDLDASSAILKRLRGLTSLPLGVKLPPYSQRHEIATMAKCLVDLGVNFVTLVNSFPLGCAIDATTRRLLIGPNEGVGGLGGKALKPIALAQVYLFAKALGQQIQIIGAGGVEHGTDVFEYLLAGASAVQIGTALHQEGPPMFARIENELLALMDAQHITDLQGIVGSVQNATL